MHYFKLAACNRWCSYTIEVNMKFIAINIKQISANCSFGLKWCCPKTKHTTRNPRRFDILQICQQIVTVYKHADQLTKKTTLQDLLNEKRNNTMCLSVYGSWLWRWIDCVCWRHIWTRLVHWRSFLYTETHNCVTYRENRQVKSSAPRLETIQMKTYSIHSQVIKGKKKTAATMLKVKHASR